MQQYIAAVIQMDSTDDKEENLKTAAEFVGEAASRGARLIALPEQMNYTGRAMQENAEDIPGGRTFSVMSELAEKFGVWLHCGSIYEKSGDSRPYNTTMLLNPKGELAAKYSKIHMFDVDLRDGPTVRESDHNTPGERIVTVDTKEVGRLGLSICYDVRFPELYRLMALCGAQIFLVPSSFTQHTGRDHWEVLLRARAVENGCYVLAPGQCGKKPKYMANGKSLIADPWGNVTALSPDRPGVITAEVDLDYLEGVRRQILTLENRREDVYLLIEAE